jgi:hypothetical protein
MSQAIRLRVGLVAEYADRAPEVVGLTDRPEIIASVREAIDQDAGERGTAREARVHDIGSGLGRK